MIERLEGNDSVNTPLTSDERLQLIPSYITLRSELNEAEQSNILKARQWAGTVRTSERNIGVEFHRIQSGLRKLLADGKHWVEHGTFAIDEIAVRFHHRLVFIHPFPNGNGRYARLATDVLLKNFARPPFTWGRTSLINISKTRKAYINALRAADGHDITLLMQFVRS